MPRVTKNSSTPILPKIPSRHTTGDHSSGSTSEHSSTQEEGFSNDGKIMYNLLSDKLDAIIAELKQRDVKIENLERENEKLRIKLQKTESRLDTLETNERCSNIVLSGKILSTVTADVTSQGIIDLFRSKLQYELAAENIISVYRLGARSGTQAGDNRRIMLKLRDRYQKADLQTACRRAKPTDLYANDDLTPSRANILFNLRHAKRRSNGKIVSCGSIDGRVFAYIRSSSPMAKHQRMFINDEAKLEELCTQHLGIPITELPMGTVDN